MRTTATLAFTVPSPPPLVVVGDRHLRLASYSTTGQFRNPSIAFSYYFDDHDDYCDGVTIAADCGAIGTSCLLDCLLFICCLL